MTNNEELKSALTFAIEMIEAQISRTLSDGGWATDEEQNARDALQSLLFEINAEHP